MFILKIVWANFGYDFELLLWSRIWVARSFLNLFMYPMVDGFVIVMWSFHCTRMCLSLYYVWLSFRKINRRESATTISFMYFVSNFFFFFFFYLCYILRVTLKLLGHTHRCHASSIFKFYFINIHMLIQSFLISDHNPSCRYL